MKTSITAQRTRRAALVRRISRRAEAQGLKSFEVRLPDVGVCRFGDREPEFAITVKDRDGLSALTRFDELSFTEAYINGDLDIEGDLWQALCCREALQDCHPLHVFWRRILPRLAGQVCIDRRAIAQHYGTDNDFFLSFLDPTRCYSQALFERDDEPLEQAQLRKLDVALHACNVKAGDRVLDVGGGWGAFVEHAGRQGVRVTALTLARPSEQYLHALIERLHLPCDVRFVDFYQYRSDMPYDAVVVLGVMEHLPDYRAVLRQFDRLLKPGGRVYLDASSSREKAAKATFISRYVFPGNHHYFCLHDFLTSVSHTDFDVQCIHNDYYSYYLTCREWAKNLERARKEICARWGEKIYRIFRLYLWGSAYAFYSRKLDAYRVVLERPAGHGERALASANGARYA